MKTVIISIHDVTPYFRKEIETILNHFSAVPISVFVTPLWDGWHRLKPDFTHLLRGSEKVLHGLTHRSSGYDFTGNLMAFSRRSDRELFHLSREQTYRRLDLGRRLFEDAFDETPMGYVPPTWFHNRHSINLLHEMGFMFTETARFILDLRQNEKNKAIPVCLDYGNNRMLEAFFTFGWRFMVHRFSPEVVRLSIHPSDVTNGFLPHFDTMIQILKDKNYTFTTYQVFFKNNQQHDFNHYLHTQRGALSA